MIYQRSSALFAEAEKVIPGGVNSPVRAFKAVGGTPIYIKEAKGAYLYDEDGIISVGHVRIFENTGNGIWTQLGASQTGDKKDDQFGVTVSLSSDGTVVAAGRTMAEDEDTGGDVRAFVYIDDDF